MLNQYRIKSSLQTFTRNDLEILNIQSSIKYLYILCGNSSEEIHPIIFKRYQVF